MAGRWWWAAVVLASAGAQAGVPIEMAVTRAEGYRRASLSAIDAKGRVGWRQELAKGETMVEVRGQFEALALSWESADGKRGSERASLELEGDVLKVEGFIVLPGSPAKPSMTLDYRLKPPPGLRMTLSEEDNSTGMAKVTLENESATAWLVESVQIAGTPPMTSESGWVSAVAARRAVAFDLEASLCARSLPAGNWRRVFRLRDLAHSQRYVEFEFPFVATPAPLHVVFPKTPFDRLRLSTELGVVQLSADDAGAPRAVCEGSVVAQEQLELKGEGRHFCGAPRDGGTSCTWVWQLGRDVGDFPPYQPAKELFPYDLGYQLLEE
jgi:hypothetical protein